VKGLNWCRQVYCYPFLFIWDPFQYYLPVYAHVFQVIITSQVSPPIQCMYFYSTAHVPQIPTTFTSSICWPV
jgi:hypothetical protein